MISVVLMSASQAPGSYQLHWQLGGSHLCKTAPLSSVLFRGSLCPFEDKDPRQRRRIRALAKQFSKILNVFKSNHYIWNLLTAAIFRAKSLKFFLVFTSQKLPLDWYNRAKIGWWCVVILLHSSIIRAQAHHSMCSCLQRESMRVMNKAIKIAHLNHIMVWISQ